MEDKEEEIQNNTSKYDLIKVKINKGVDGFIVDKEFYFRFEMQTKDNIRIFKCKENRKASKCTAIFKIKDDNIIDKNFIHNHSGNANECSKYIFKSAKALSAYACPRSRLSRGRSLSSGSTPKLAPIG